MTDPFFWSPFLDVLLAFVGGYLVGAEALKGKRR